jgi:hypothetical protein
MLFSIVVFGNMLRNILGTHWKVTRTSWEPFENLVRTKKSKQFYNKISNKTRYCNQRRAAIPCEKNDKKSTAPTDDLGPVRIKF